ncbi:DNA/RNA non-specific endonuclease [Anaerolineales bacterium HSG25]|nr:DNA/RNA non-specific endonuclease [Anaerolineales bacterium HSG25]
MTIYYIFRKYIWTRRHGTYTWWFARTNHRLLGEPCKSDIVFDRQGYSLGFSKKWKSALWVSYIITKWSISVDVNRGGSFYADTNVPKDCRIKSDDYAGIGYDRGHLAPSATVDFSHASNNETFIMSNIVPQHPALNRQAWGSLEDTVRKWTFSKGKLAVVTGPIYGKRPRRVNGIPIPKAFYKVIYAFNHDKSIGFILPNRAINSAKLWRYAMSVKNVEKATTYKFFNKLGRKGQSVKANLNTSWWKS